MKTKLFSAFLTLLFFLTQFLSNTYAQDYTQLNLPKDAKARFGKGTMNDMQISPDSTKLAIASSIGVWLYDINTGDETALISGHTDVVRFVVFSPDSKILASSANDKTVRLWDIKTGENFLTLHTPEGIVGSLKFLANSKTLVGQNWKGTVSFWDITNGQLLNTFTPKLPIFSSGKYKGWLLQRDAFVDRIGVVTFTIVNKDGTITIKNGQTGKEIRTLTSRTNDSQFFRLEGEPTVRIVKPMPIDERQYHTTYMDDGTPFPIQYQLGHLSSSYSVLEEHPMKWLTNLEFAPDGKTLVSWSSYRNIRRGGWNGTDGPIEIWDVDTGEQLAALRSGRVQDVEFSGDGKFLALAGYSGCVIWEITTRREIATFPDVETVRFSGDGKTIVLIGKDYYTLWDIATRSEIAKLSPVLDEFKPFQNRFVFSQDGTMLATTHPNGVVNLWLTQTGKPLLMLTTGYTKPFMALAFSHDGKTLVGGDIAGNIHLWNTNTLSKQKMIKQDGRVHALAFTKDNTNLITESGGKIKVWNVNLGNQENAYTIPDALKMGYGNTFNDGTTFDRNIVGVFVPHTEKLAILTENGMEIWDTLNAKNLNTFTNIDKYDFGLMLTSNGLMLADRKGSAIRLQNANTGQEIARLKIPKNLIDSFLERFHLRNSGIYSVAFTPDGKTVAAGTGNKKIHLWDVATHQRAKPFTGHKHAVCELTFSSDGKILASGDTGGKIHLWEFAVRRHIATFEAYKGFVHTLVFAPDGKTLASLSYNRYSQNGTIYLWNVPPK